MAKNMKNLENISISSELDLRNNTISNLRGQSQCRRITNRLTKWSSKVPKQLDLLCHIWKTCDFFINKHNVKYIILGTYFWSNLIRIENQTVSTKKAAKKEEPLNLNPAEPDKVKMRTMN